MFFFCHLGAEPCQTIALGGVWGSVVLRLLGPCQQAPFAGSRPTLGSRLVDKRIPNKKCLAKCQKCQRCQRIHPDTSLEGSRNLVSVDFMIRFGGSLPCDSIGTWCSSFSPTRLQGSHQLLQATKTYQICCDAGS